MQQERYEQLERYRLNRQRKLAESWHLEAERLKAARQEEVRVRLAQLRSQQARREQRQHAEEAAAKAASAKAKTPADVKERVQEIQARVDRRLQGEVVHTWCAMMAAKHRRKAPPKIILSGLGANALVTELVAAEQAGTLQRLLWQKMQCAADGQRASPDGLVDDAGDRPSEKAKPVMLAATAAEDDHKPGSPRHQARKHRPRPMRSAADQILDGRKSIACGFRAQEDYERWRPPPARATPHLGGLQALAAAGAGYPEGPARYLLRGASGALSAR